MASKSAAGASQSASSSCLSTSGRAIGVTGWSVSVSKALDALPMQRVSVSRYNCNLCCVRPPVRWFCQGGRREASSSSHKLTTHRAARPPACALTASNWRTRRASLSSASVSTVAPAERTKISASEGRRRRGRDGLGLCVVLFFLSVFFLP